MTPLGRRRLLQSGVAAALLAVSGMPARARSRGGKLTAALSGASVTDTWDGRTHAGVFMMAAASGAVFDTLTEVAADGSLKGELATQWVASADARIWTFDLRQGVRFHDGTAFSAEDVIASLLRHKDLTSPAAPILAEVERIEKTGSHQVRFELRRGNADFPYLLSDYHLLIYPASDIAGAIETGNGTGLYRVKHFAPGDRLVATRVADHYKGEGAGFFDEIEYIAMNDASRRVSALMMGKVDAINSVPLAALGRIAESPAVQLQTVQGNRHISFSSFTGAVPFADPDVKMALKYGLDRVSLLNDVLGGHGAIASDSPIGPANQFFASDVVPVQFDPERAAFHLRNAGLNGLCIDLGYDPRDGNEAEANALLFKASAAMAGIEIQVSATPDREWNAASWSGRATEDWMLSAAYGVDTPWNGHGWGPERFQDLVTAARSELDSDLRREMYHELQIMLRDDGPSIIPAFTPFLQATSNRVGTPETIGNLFDMDSARMAERWWSA